MRILCLSVLYMLLSAQLVLLHADKKILFISSYHPGFPTFYKQVDGLRSVFDETGDIALDVEFMDTKRIPVDQAFKALEQRLKLLGDIVNEYDLIIAGDDNAMTEKFGWILQMEAYFLRLQVSNIAFQDVNCKLNEVAC